MKNILIVFALIFSLFSNEAFADNRPQTKIDNNIIIDYNGHDYVQVWLKQLNTDQYNVKIYDLNFKLLYTEALSGKPGERFNVSKLDHGFYLILIEKGNRAVHTEVIEKVQNNAFAKY